MVDGGIRIERFRHYSSSQQTLLKDPFNNFEQGMQYLMLRMTIDDIDKFPFPENGQKHYISIGESATTFWEGPPIHEIRGERKQVFYLE